MLACVCGGTLELIAAIGLPSLLGLGAWLWDHLTLKNRIARCRKTCSHVETCATADGPKVGSVSLSPRDDRRMPSDADAWLQ